MARILIIVGTESGNAQMCADHLSDILPSLGHEIEVAGDAFFPPLDTREWRETACENWPAADGHPAHAFVTLERRGD